MSNTEERPWWSIVEDGHMYTPGANARVASVLMTYDNELTSASSNLAKGIANVEKDHPEIRDTVVREWLADAIEDILGDLVIMMTLGNQACSQCQGLGCRSCAGGRNPHVSSSD